MVLAFPINFFESTVASLCYCHAGIFYLARHFTANCRLLKHKMCDLSCRRSISLRTQNMSSSKSRAQREALGKCAWFQTFWLCTSLMGVRASWHWLLNFFNSHRHVVLCWVSRPAQRSPDSVGTCFYMHHMRMMHGSRLLKLLDCAA